MRATAAWLAGMLAISSIIMCIGIWPLLRMELNATHEPWRQNKALRLAFALWLHGAGSLVLFSSTLFAGLRMALGIERVAGTASVALWMAWLALTLWLVAKTMIVSVAGRLRLCLALYAVWTVVCVGWVWFNDGSFF